MFFVVCEGFLAFLTLTRYEGVANPSSPPPTTPVTPTHFQTPPKEPGHTCFSLDRESQDLHTRLTSGHTGSGTQHVPS